MAEAYRSRTYRRPLDRPLDLKSRRHTGDETLPLPEFAATTIGIGQPAASCSHFDPDPQAWDQLSVTPVHTAFEAII